MTANGNQDPQTRYWHPDRRVPMALIITLAVGFLTQAGLFAYFTGQNTERLEYTQTELARLAPVIEGFYRLESAVTTDRKAINARLDRIEDKIDRVIGAQQ